MNRQLNTKDTIIKQIKLFVDESNTCFLFKGLKLLKQLAVGCEIDSYLLSCLFNSLADFC